MVVLENEYPLEEKTEQELENCLGLDVPTF